MIFPDKVSSILFYAILLIYLSTGQSTIPKYQDTFAPKKYFSITAIYEYMTHNDTIL